MLGELFAPKPDPRITEAAVRKAQAEARTAEATAASAEAKVSEKTFSWSHLAYAILTEKRVAFRFLLVLGGFCLIAILVWFWESYSSQSGRNWRSRRRAVAV